MSAELYDAAFRYFLIIFGGGIGIALIATILMHIFDDCFDDTAEQIRKLNERTINKRK